MKKRMLSILLVAMMLFSTMSVLAISVSAAEDPYLKVAGATMTDGQCLIKGSIYPVDGIPEGAESYAYYKNGVLTLHNYSLYGPNMTRLIEADSNLPFKILLEGENVLKGNPETTTAIWANYELDIMGSGSLTISDVAYGIDRSDNYRYAKNLYITDATLNISSTNEAINSTSALNVTAAKLTVESTATGKSAIKNSGDISFYASEVEATANGYAIEAAGEFANVNIYGSKVKAVSSAKQAIKYSEKLTFDNGDITENVVTKASTNADGSSWVTYEKNNNSTYKYVECELPGYFVVSFDANGGSGYTKSAAFRNGENAHADYLVCTFTAPDGKYFYGWDKSIIGRPITENLTLKAVWRDKTGIDHIDFSMSGYELGNTSVTVTTSTDGVTIVADTLKISKAPFGTFTEFEANTRYYIKFDIKVDKAYKLNFNPTDYMGRIQFRMQGLYADTVTYNESKDVYSLVMNGEPLPEAPCTVKFDAGEGTGSKASITHSGALKLPMPGDSDFPFTAPEGKRFKTWAVIAEGNQNPYYIDVFDYYFINENITLLAQWEDITKHTVNFYKNDGTEAIEKSVTLYDGEKITVANFPTLADRGEYKFYGWSLAKDSYVPITSDIQPTEDTNVYAIWRANVDKVTFKLEGYEIGKNVKDIRLTDDKGFLTTNVIDLEKAIFCIYNDKDGQPLIATSAEDAEAYMKFINEGKFEEGKNYWLVVVIQDDEYHTGAGDKEMVVPKTPSGYKLEGAADATVKIMGDAIGFCFKLDPPTAKVQEPSTDNSDTGTTTPDGTTDNGSNSENTDTKTDNNASDNSDANENSDGETEKSGCGSSLTGICGIAMLGIVSMAAVTVKKKK